eukprot:GSA25T00014270001.1
MSGFFDSFEHYFVQKIGERVESSFAHRFMELQMQVDSKTSDGKFVDLATATEHLTAGVLRLAEVTGVIPPPQAARGGRDREECPDRAACDFFSDNFDGTTPSWRESSRMLAVRIEKVWRARSAGKCRSILDLVARKADMGLLKLLQQSVQDLELQLCQIFTGKNQFAPAILGLGGGHHQQASMAYPAGGTMRTTRGVLPWPGESCSRYCGMQQHSQYRRAQQHADDDPLLTKNKAALCDAPPNSSQNHSTYQGRPQGNADHSDG